MDPFQVWLPAMATHTKSIAGGHWWAIENPITAHDLKSVYTECKLVRPVESCVSVQGEECLGFIIHLHLQIGTPQVNLREMLAATKRGEDIVDALQGILVHLQLCIDCHLEVSTYADCAVLLRYWDNRHGPVTVRNFRQNSVLFQTVTDSVAAHRAEALPSTTLVEHHRRA